MLDGTGSNTAEGSNSGEPRGAPPRFRYACKRGPHERAKVHEQQKGNWSAAWLRGALGWGVEEAFSHIEQRRADASALANPASPACPNAPRLNEAPCEPHLVAHACQVGPKAAGAH